MIESRTILCFASGYDAPPTSKHHVMHLLAERNRVLWVNYHASRAPQASGADFRHMARKLGEVCRGLKNPRENLYVLTPLVVPLPSARWARRLNCWLLVRQVCRALWRMRRGPVQLWSFTPDVTYLLDRFGEGKVVYYCVDDHAAFSGYDRAQVLRDEEALCRRADLVVTTSRALQEARSPWNPNTILVSHGVDYEHFAKSLADGVAIPADVAGIPRPRLGFFGLIRDWVDLDLLAAVARARPEWHLVLIGDSAVELAPYRSLPNMHFLGRRPYEQLPAYCKAFDVGLIPFKLNDLTRAVNPIKLREYLAAGLPVVSTPLPEVRPYEPLVRVGEGAGPFAEGIASALNGDSAPELRSRRSAAMAAETWPAKVAAITAELVAHRSPSPPGSHRPVDSHNPSVARA